MGREFELKYASDPAQQEKILEDLGEFITICMETSYYDTPDGALAARKITLRRRMENGVSVCTLKTPAGIDGRSEYEWHCEDIHEAIPHLSRLTGSNALNQLVERGLVETCGARFTRTARMFRAGATMVELAMDQGVLTNAGKEEPFAELEIELKRGYREEVQVMGFLLAEAYELEPETKSKYQRSRELGAKK
jgi:inorganic triphosphatase YgiF